MLEGKREDVSDRVKRRNRDRWKQREMKEESIELIQPTHSSKPDSLLFTGSWRQRQPHAHACGEHAYGYRPECYSFA